MNSFRPFANFDIRERMRLDHNARVVVYGEGFGRREGSLRDISQIGAYLYLDHGGPLVLRNGRVQLHLIFSARTSRLSVEAEARVVRRDHEGIAVRFVDPLAWWAVFSMFPMGVEIVEEEMGAENYEAAVTEPEQPFQLSSY